MALSFLVSRISDNLVLAQGFATGGRPIQISRPKIPGTEVNFATRIDRSKIAMNFLGLLCQYY